MAVHSFKFTVSCRSPEADVKKVHESVPSGRREARESVRRGGGEYLVTVESLGDMLRMMDLVREVGDWDRLPIVERRAYHEKELRVGSLPLLDGRKRLEACIDSHFRQGPVPAGEGHRLFRLRLDC